MSKPVPCIICEYEPDPVFSGEHGKDIENQPHAATSFYSQGHYGSTVFDPMDGSFLEINICDKCLVEKKESILHGYSKQNTETKYEKWEPNV